MVEAMLDTARTVLRHLLAAAVLIAAIGGGAVAWSFHASIDGALIAAGTVVVEGHVKKVQPSAGGIIGDIAVREGSKIAPGDLLIRLDQTVTRANLDIVLNNLTSQRARLARLQALRDGMPGIAFPEDLVVKAAVNAAIRSVLQGESRLREAQIGGRTEQTKQRLQRVKQLRQEIQGFEEQRIALTGQIGIARKELDDLMPLFQSGNVQRPRIRTLERELLRNQGLLGDATAKIAQSEAKIAETELQTAESDQDFLASVIQDLRDTETKIAELQEKRIAAEDQLKRLDIRAPIAGIVHQLSVHTIGGVVSPSETLMLIVPTADHLVVEVRVDPADIDQLSAGQDVRIRFPAFDRRTTEELQGSLFRIAADLTREPERGLSYYAAVVRVPESELAKLNGLRLAPGMPAEVFIKTGERTLASYVVKPLRDQMQRAFRER